jgi:4'-phosphopantetheinyl transferase EntD
MNYVAHALVASEVMPDATEAYVFGAMAPDLVGMAGTKLVRHSEHADLADGVELHIATDSVFDSNPLFTVVKAKFRPIHEEYLPRGAARTCADAGTEMLLDGFVLQKAQAAELYRRTIEAAAGGAFPLGQLAVDQVAFLNLVGHAGKVGVPYFYQDPEVVATRLHRRLLSRERLRFGEALIPRVAETFAAQQADVGRVANHLVEQTISQLATEETLPDVGPVTAILPGLTGSVQRIRGTNFDGGREAANQALQQAGFAGQVTIERSPKGAPLFPDGFTGSISHTKDWAVAVAANARDYASVGVDVEAADRVFKRDIATRVTDEVERDQFSDFGVQDTLVISSLKEAIYKALFPQAQRWIGFHEVALRRVDENTTHVELVTDDLQAHFTGRQVTTVMTNDAKWHTSICHIR